MGRMRRTQSIQRSPHGGEVSIEWEIVEFGDNGDDDVTMAGNSSAGVSTPSKRKMQDRGNGEAAMDEPSPPQQHQKQ